MKRFLLVVTLFAAGLAAQPSIDGAWYGTLSIGAQKLRLQLNLTTAAGGLTADLISVDQGNAKMAAGATRDGAAIKVEVKSLGVAIDGKFDAGFTRIDATFAQAGATFPIVFTRTQDEAPKRPQNPVKPYPYKEEDVTYANPAAGGIKLAATITIPQGQGPFPGVVLIIGSGPQDRDETIMNHKPFLVLSDYLTRHGIVVLRADDRGTAKSQGNFATATTADFATDAEAGVAYLKTRPEVNTHKMGLIGHSEGGVIAPMVAARNKDVAFIVLLAGTGVSGDKIIVAQVEDITRASGRSDAQVEEAAKKQRQVLDLVMAEKDDAAAQAKLKEQFGIPEAQSRALVSVWYRYFLSFDPATALRKVTCPVLALNGSKDTQVPARLNLPAIRKALEEAGNKHFETVEMPGLNHLFQHAKSGAPSEYAAIEETMSPEVLEKVATWIAAQ